MGSDVDLEIQVSRAPAPGCLLTLTCKTDQLSIGHTYRDRDANRMCFQSQRPVRLEVGSLQIQRSRGAFERLLEIDIDARMMIARCPTAGSPEGAPATTAESPPAEQRGKEIAEAFRLLEFFR